MAAGDLGSIEYRFEAGALADVRAEIVRFRWTEALDEPYLADVELTLHDLDADPTVLLGTDAVLTVARPPLERRLCGVVRTTWVGQAAPMDAVRARVEVVPALDLLALRRDTRMFQERTVPEILEAVLGEGLGPYGREVRSESTASYPTREYCLQYQETDLSFVHRLMQEEGITYAFDHQGDVEVMILRDTNSAHPRVDSATDPIEVTSHDLHLADREIVHDFSRRHRHTTTSVVVRDFDWTTSGFLVEDERRDQDAKGRDRESYEHGLGRSVTLSDYGAAAKRYQGRDAPRQKEVRHEAHTVGALTAEGVGRAVGFAAGTVFGLTGHETVGVDGDYLVTRVTHVSDPAPGVPDGAEGYHNRFECIPVDVPYRPRRTARKPRIPGIQTANVTGPSGEEIHTDEHGRIKVQFHWDRENERDEKSSCWVRCEQAWAGAGWGFWWIPRIDMEVVVQFVDGDPDRPLVTGCVYDGTNTPPYSLPGEKTKSTIKSSSSPGGAGFNELRFEDAAGSEQIYVHAQRDYDEVVERHHTTTVHRDQLNEVDGNQSQTIHGNQTERVDGDQSLSVGGDRTIDVEGDFDETVDGTETRSVASDVSETFDANEARDVAGDVTEMIGASETRSVGADQSETIGAGHTLTVAGDDALTVSGSFTQTVLGGITQTTPATYDITAAAGFTITAPGGVTWVAPGGVQILAPGGTFMVDPFNDWCGAKFIETSGKSDTLIAVKLESGVGIMEAFGAKLELYPIFMTIESLKKEKRGVLLKNVAAKVEGAGIKSWKDVLHHEG